MMKIIVDVSNPINEAPGDVYIWGPHKNLDPESSMSRNMGLDKIAKIRPIKIAIHHFC